MILLSDFVIDFLVQKGIKDIFLVSGGGIMYLLDSIYRNKKIDYISNYHEQASAIAAEGYARIKNSPSVCLVTTGPGSTNAVTGVAGAWVESIPVIYISGQVKRETIADYKKHRQLGMQEINIIDIVKKITKYAKEITNPNLIAYELEKAFFEAVNGRPGPVWISIPLDVQSTLIDEKKLKHFTPPKNDKLKKQKLKNDINNLIVLLKKSERPVIIAGFGIRLSGAIEAFKKLVKLLDIPVIHNINGVDILSENNPNNMGLVGPFGQRRANFTIQNSDLVISIGSSLGIETTGFNFDDFAPKAKKVAINIDENELNKPNFNADLPIVADAKAFIDILFSKIKYEKFKFSDKWKEVCLKWKEKYPIMIDEYFRDKKHVNSYVFMDVLSDLLGNNDVLTTGIGLDVVSYYTAFKVKENQRTFVNKHFGGMGWCLPLAIGVCAGNDRNKTICVTGDGSIQFNIQELNTIKYYQLPIKMFVFNNRGYKSIRDTQVNLFEGRLVGADESSGVGNLNFKKLASVYNFKYSIINNNSELKSKIKKVINEKGPVICEVNIAFDQIRMPKTHTYRGSDGKLYSMPLENMWPFLPKEEVKKNMSFFK